MAEPSHSQAVLVIMSTTINPLKPFLGFEKPFWNPVDNFEAQVFMGQMPFPSPNSIKALKAVTFLIKGMQCNSLSSFSVVFSYSKQTIKNKFK